jgi:hypothetical protein
MHTTGLLLILVEKISLPMVKPYAEDAMNSLKLMVTANS